MSRHIQIGTNSIGLGYPVYLVAELSANHGNQLEHALQLVHAAKESGADAVKLQTYRADTLTFDGDQPFFKIRGGTPWDGKTLHTLYQEAATPWEWYPRLAKEANALGLTIFSSPFDATAVDFLEIQGTPAYKIASFELVDLPLIRKVAKTGKPIILSTGMATLGEIEEAVNTAREAGARELLLLKCTSAYPSPVEDMNLRTIPHLSKTFNVPVGLSDHTLETTTPVAAVAMGACFIEKHLTLSRSAGGPDASFSLEPAEFAAMAKTVRQTERALGVVRYSLTPSEISNQTFRRSLFVVQDMHTGDTFNMENVRSIRPSHGLHTRYLEQILGCKATCDILKGTPLEWAFIQSQGTHT